MGFGWFICIMWLVYTDDWLQCSVVAWTLLDEDSVVAWVLLDEDNIMQKREKEKLQVGDWCYSGIVFFIWKKCMEVTWVVLC